MSGHIKSHQLNLCAPNLTPRLTEQEQPRSNVSGTSAEIPTAPTSRSIAFEGRGPIALTKGNWPCICETCQSFRILLFGRFYRKPPNINHENTEKMLGAIDQVVKETIKRTPLIMYSNAKSSGAVISTTRYSKCICQACIHFKTLFGERLKNPLQPISHPNVGHIFSNIDLAIRIQYDKANIGSEFTRLQWDLNPKGLQIRQLEGHYHYPFPLVTGLNYPNVLESEFYCRVLLFSSLQQSKDIRNSREYTYGKEVDDQDDTELRRKFLDCIAYCCDFDKAPGRVTAAALQHDKSSDPGRIILWLAANQGMQINTLKFVQEVIELARDPSCSTEEKETKLLKKIMDFCSEKLGKYRSSFSILGSQVRRQLKKICQDDDQIPQWRQDIGELLRANDLQLIQSCFKTRQMWTSRMLSLSEKVNVSSEFTEFSHYMYRLGQHQYSAEIIIRAMERVPALQNIQLPEIRTPVPSDFPTDRLTCPLRLGDDYLDSGKIISVLLNTYSVTRRDLRRYWSQGELGRQSVHAECNNYLKDNRKITRCFHAELQLASTFSKSDLDYADEDRFIGCSKAACYLCFAYLKACDAIDPRRFGLPATHHRIIANVKIPPYHNHLVSENPQYPMISILNAQVEMDLLSILCYGPRKITSQRDSSDDDEKVNAYCPILRY